MNLNKQQLLLADILRVCPIKVINMWQALAKQLPSNKFNFCRKALILCVPNKSNLYIVGRLQKTIYAFLPSYANTNSCVAKL